MPAEIAPALLVRLLPGIVGESRRVVHQVPLPAGGGVPDVLIAYCGERIEPNTAEMLPQLCGMPCVACMAIALSRPRGEQRAAR